MYEIIVHCSNGGDWEWYNTRSNWIDFIMKHIQSCEYRTHFNIVGNTDAYKATIQFNDPHHLTIFALIKPEYI